MTQGLTLILSNLLSTKTLKVNTKNMISLSASVHFFIRTYYFEAEAQRSYFLSNFSMKSSPRMFLSYLAAVIMVFQ